MVQKRRDILWKSIIEEFPEHFIRFFYKDADSLFNLAANFDFLDKELEQIAPDWEFMKDSKIVDKLLKVRSNIQNLEWLLLLVEIQGYGEKDFTARVFNYFTRLVDKYGKRIMVLVIYTNTGKSFAPSA